MCQFLVCERLKIVFYTELRVFLLLSVYLLCQKQSVRCLGVNYYLQSRLGLIFHHATHKQEFFPSEEQAEAMASGVARCAAPVCVELAPAITHQSSLLHCCGTVTVDRSLTVFDDMNNAAAVFPRANCPWKAAVIARCNNRSSFISRHNRLPGGNSASG